MIHSYQAPAKINLSLHITGKRPDEYHELSSIVVFTEFGDNIEIEECSHFEFEVKGQFGKNLPLDNENLVVKSAEKLAALLKKELNFKITLNKNMPISSGIGGGSSDAAATLKALMDLWQVKELPLNFNEFLLSIGADLPVCFAQKPCLMSGIGEKLQFIKLPFSFPLLLINPLMSLRTPDVFKKRTGGFSSPLSITNISSWDQWLKFLQATKNDLTEAAISLCPAIHEILDHLKEDSSCVFTRLSGSGATCFGIYRTVDEAYLAAEKIKCNHPEWWFQVTQTSAQY